jgi:hypothetical protein
VIFLIMINGGCSSIRFRKLCFSLNRVKHSFADKNLGLMPDCRDFFGRYQSFNDIRIKPILSNQHQVYILGPTGS